MLNFYFDMDGVLCNFDKKIQELKLNSGRNVSSDSLTGEEKNQRETFWKEIGKMGTEFWESLESVDIIYNYIKLLKPLADEKKITLNILTKVPTNPACHDYAIKGKQTWIETHFGKNFFNKILIIDSDKTKYCKDINDILIDDRESNCSKWKQAGGTSFIFNI